MELNGGLCGHGKNPRSKRSDAVSFLVGIGGLADIRGNSPIYPPPPRGTLSRTRKRASTPHTGAVLRGFGAWAVAILPFPPSVP